MNEKEYLLKGIKFMEDTAPSKWNVAMIAGLKIKYLPRLKKYINGEFEDSYENAKEVFGTEKE